MKKFFSTLLILLLILAQIPAVSLARSITGTTGDETDIIISSVSTTNLSTSGSSIYEGNKFRLTITLNINSNISNVYVMLDKSSSFSPVGTGAKKPVVGNKVSFDMYYNGGDSSQIPITIYYNKESASQTISDYISITDIIPSGSSDNTPSTPVDTSKYMPLLSISNSKIPVGQAGSTITIPLTIKNNSNYYAKNVIITPEFIGDNSPFTIEDISVSQTISKIEGNKTASINLKLSIDSSAAEKNYPIKINYQYSNAHGNSGTSSETIYIKVTNKNVPPRLVIEKIDINPSTIGPGDNVTVGFNIKNIGTLDAKDIKFTIDGLANDGFILSSGSNTQYQKTISGSFHGYISFNLKASNRISRGSHGLDLKISYKDSQNQVYEDTQKFYLTVGGKSGASSNLVIDAINYPSDGIRPGKDFNLSFDLKNMGKLDATNIKVSVESADPAVVPKTASIKKINTLEPGKSENLSFVFTPTQDATTKNYPINITVEYEDELNAGKDKYVVTQYVGVYVDNGSGKGKPKLIIDQYSFEPAIAKAGENYTMNLSFFNTNKQKSVQNIKIFLTVDEKTEQSGSVFTPVGSSNTFYIDSIPPKGRVQKNITMFTVPDAKAKTYTITANFEYEDDNGQEYTATELIGVPVVQQAKLEIGELNLPPEAYVGQPLPVSVEFYNTGKVTLYNMMIKLEGDFQTENGSYFLGNFETGNSEFFEGNVIPSQPGEISGNVVFSYEDSSGEQVEIRKEFKLNVVEMPPMEPMPEDMNPDMNGGKKNILKSKGFWITIIIIAAAVVGIIIYKKNKKKKGMALDE